ncbi:MAG: peptide-methionine (R)-S-oxide reductase MsrB [Candidatus Buchananbacteria bacterium]|nr:peptide-methionine (R)-S-oxide reductase MsrB [Candidatus Buchananbacteria bacterium]
MTAPIKKTEAEWEQELSPEQYRVLRQKGTEAPFSGKLLHYKETGIYACAACGAELFSSDTKFDSGSGWPSFSDVLKNENLKTAPDTSHGMHRLEIMCGRCESHLGHVFDDGPTATGKRYCVNSLSLTFKKTK